MNNKWYLNEQFKSWYFRKLSQHKNPFLLAPRHTFKLRLLTSEMEQFYDFKTPNILEDNDLRVVVKFELLDPDIQYLGKIYCIEIMKRKSGKGRKPTMKVFKWIYDKKEFDFSNIVVEFDKTDIKKFDYST